MCLGEFFAVTTLWSFDWSIDVCWPVLARAQLWTSVGNRNEFLALLLLHWNPIPERDSFWNHCDELIQEWLNIVQERADSEDFLLCVEGQSGF